MPQVNDYHRLARFQLELQFLGRDAVALDLLQETLPLAPPVQDVGDDGGEEQHQDPSAKALRVNRRTIELPAEEKAKPDKSACPQQGSEEIEEHEVRKGHAQQPRHGWGRR